MGTLVNKIYGECEQLNSAKNQEVKPYHIYDFFPKWRGGGLWCLGGSYW